MSLPIATPNANLTDAQKKFTKKQLPTIIANAHEAAFNNFLPTWTTLNLTSASQGGDIEFVFSYDFFLKVQNGEKIPKKKKKLKALYQTVVDACAADPELNNMVLFLHQLETLDALIVQEETTRGNTKYVLVAGLKPKVLAQSFVVAIQSMMQSGQTEFLDGVFGPDNFNNLIRAYATLMSVVVHRVQ